MQALYFSPCNCTILEMVDFTAQRSNYFPSKNVLLFLFSTVQDMQSVTLVSFVQLLHGLINQRRMLKLRSSKATMFYLCVRPKGFLCRWNGKLRRRVKTRYRSVSVSLVINTTLYNLQVPGFILSRLQHSRVTTS